MLQWSREVQWINKLSARPYSPLLPQPSHLLTSQLSPCDASWDWGWLIVKLGFNPFGQMACINGKPRSPSERSQAQLTIYVSFYTQHMNKILLPCFFFSLFFLCNLSIFLSQCWWKHNEWTSSNFHKLLMEKQFQPTPRWPYSTIRTKNLKQS